jgi:hypothetical protein
MTPLPPWANGPFELLMHAEGHLLNGDDFDRRIALISFDDAIEIAITTYLTLHPIQRGNRAYPNDKKDRWLKDYHTKLDFLGEELVSRSLPWEVERSHIVWVHDHRNEQYHGGKKGTPERNVLMLVRKASLWIFSMLFEVPDAEAFLKQAILDIAPPSPPQRIKEFDLAIDDKYGIVDVADQTFYVSETLFSTDFEAYRDLGKRLCESSVSDTAGDLK